MKENLKGKYVIVRGDRSEVLGINQQSISKCCRGERNKTGGFIWKY